MKFILATFAILLIGINALPQDEATLSGGQNRLVANNIQRTVEQMNERIREAGLDPFHINHHSTQVITPIGGFGVWIDDLWCSGISHNHFDRLDYSILTSRLRVDFVWDDISCETRSAGVKVSLLGHEMSVEQSGGVEINQLRVRGDLRFTFRPIGGVSLRDCDLDLTANIKSDLRIITQDHDLSDHANKAIANLNDLLRAKRDAIGKQLCALVESVL